MTMPEPLYLKIKAMEPQMGDIKSNVQTLAECRCRPWRQAVWREFRNSPIPALTLLSSPCCLRRKGKAKGFCVYLVPFPCSPRTISPMVVRLMTMPSSSKIAFEIFC